MHLRQTPAYLNDVVMTKRILVRSVTGILIVLIAVAAIVFYRAMQLSHDIPEVDQVTYDDIDLDRAVERLSQALQFRTVSTQELTFLYRPEFDRFIDFLEDEYPEVHNTLERERVNGYTLLFKWEGTDPDLPAAMFQGHYDVVPVEPGTEDDWTHPPFSGNISDGFVWGRGAIDDKSGIFSYLEALDYLIAKGYQPGRTMYVALNHDEEIGGRMGARKVADLMLERETDIAFVADEGMPVAQEIMEGLEHPIAMIGVAEKGYVSVELNIQKEGGHSSMPPRLTTIGVLSSAIKNLKENPMTGRFAGLLRETFEPLAPDLPLAYRLALANLWLFGGMVEERLGYIPHTNAALRTTTAPTMFHAGVKENVLPQTARAVVNFRIHPDDSVQDVLDYVRETIVNDDIEIRVMEGAREPSPITPTSSESFQAMKHTIHEIFPGIPVAPSMFLAATDARHFPEVTENLFRFRPIRARPDDAGRIHGTDERIGIENFGEMIAFYIRMMKNTTSGQEFNTGQFSE